MNPKIVYGDKVKYKDKIGLVKEIQGSVIRVHFEGHKKTTILQIDLLEKVND